ncbi:hypothetical protein ACP70R_034201 [Stipagrostis hirtigluma subsp. patula]
MEEGSAGGAAAARAGTNEAEAEAEAEAVMARFSLDVSAGCGGRHSTLLDEYERLAFEAQLNRAIVLRRCYSEPSPVRFVQQPPADGRPSPAPAPPPRGTEQREGAAAGRSWRLHEAVGRWLEALKPVLCWLRSAWERRRRKEPAAGAARRPPPTMPRVQLMDYLR